ncbi:Enoyl-[acyl-carrier-protein] reductase [FMN], partial [hydrothermal vent metagenome]
KFGLDIPLALAPMALASGGALAAACASSGVLGLVGGGYGNLEWTSREYQLAMDIIGDDVASQARLGCGFISWKLAEDAAALDWLLHTQKPAAIMLSFGDPRPYSKRILDSGAVLICQIQTLGDLPIAVEAGADIIVAQGTEAGGHGATQEIGRGTFSFIAEAADWLAIHAPNTMLLGAGGIADGRGLAAALMLGADGALMGSRFWATAESIAAQPAKDMVVEANGDETARSGIFDILRRKNWPDSFDFRALRNDLHKQWEGRVDELRANPGTGRKDYDTGVANADFTKAHIGLGESVGLINDLPEAAQLITGIKTEFEHALKKISTSFG